MTSEQWCEWCGRQIPEAFDLEGSSVGACCKDRPEVQAWAKQRAAAEAADRADEKQRAEHARRQRWGKGWGRR